MKATTQPRKIRVHEDGVFRPDDETDDHHKDGEIKILKRKELDLPVAKMGYNQDLGLENINTYKSPLKKFKDEKIQNKSHK